ncbi:hypothetical protein EV175_006490 [Coemansia sp. RSA 1933]|nr:hypothetical protein EV175_006490 [Coemansia sp. RSA 1933]
MFRSDAYLGPYHRSLPVGNPNQKRSDEAEKQQLEVEAPRPSLTTPLLQTSRSIRVHPASNEDGDNENSEHILPPLSSVYDVSAPHPAGRAAPATMRPPPPMMSRHSQHHHPYQYQQKHQQQQRYSGHHYQHPPQRQFSYRNHYQQHPPPPLLPHQSAPSSARTGSSPLTPSTPVSQQHAMAYHHSGRAPVAMPGLGSPTVSLSSPSASPVGNGTYAYISNKRTHAEIDHVNSSSSSSQGRTPARKRSRHAWSTAMTRQIINVLLDEFLTDSAFRTTIYRSREERDPRFEPSGRSILEEYNKIQNTRRRYFIPLSYLLQWDKMRSQEGTEIATSRQRANIEKKLAKPLERSRLQMIFCSSMKKNGDESMTAVQKGYDDDEETVTADGKPMFELDIFVAELKRRDFQLWSRGAAAFHSWVSRKCSVDFIINH